MSENEKVHFYELVQGDILGEDDAEERLADNLENYLKDWNQHTDVLMTEQ